MRFLAWLSLIFAWFVFFNIMNFQSDPHNYAAIGFAFLAMHLFNKADITDLENEISKLKDIR